MSHIDINTVFEHQNVTEIQEIFVDIITVGPAMDIAFLFKNCPFIDIKETTPKYKTYFLQRDTTMYMYLHTHGCYSFCMPVGVV